MLFSVFLLQVTLAFATFSYRATSDGVSVVRTFSDGTKKEVLVPQKRQAQIASLVGATGPTLLMRTFGSDHQFVWSDVDSVNTNTGAITTLVAASVFYEITITVDNIGAFDHVSGQFTFGTDAGAGKCLGDIPVHAVDVRTKQLAPTSQLFFSDLFSLTADRSTSGGVLVFGERAKKPGLVKFNPGPKPSLVDYNLPPGLIKRIGPSAFDHAYSVFYVVAQDKPGSNASLVTALDLKVSPPKATSFTLNCNTGAAMSVHYDTKGDKLVAIFENFSSKGVLTYFAAEIDIKTKACTRQTLLNTQKGIVTCDTFDHTKQVMYAGEATSVGFLLHTIDFSGPKITDSTMKLQKVAVDLEFGVV